MMSTEQQEHYAVIVAGTDTNVGKTVCAALLTCALDACYWKPVQSGLEDETDAQTVARIAGVSEERIFPEAYRLSAPMSPDQAARRDGVTVNDRELHPPKTERNLVIEGAGGLFVPLNDTLLQIDLFARWNLPLLLVARSTLGTLNHTLLSLEALSARKIPVAGIVLVGPRHEENEKTLQRWSSIPVRGIIPPLERIDRDELLRVYRAFWQPVEEWVEEKTTTATLGNSRR